YPPFDIVEITVPAGGLPTIDVQTVDGFIFPMTLTLFDSGNNPLGQVGQPPYPPGAQAVVNRNDVFAAYTTFMTAQGGAGAPYLALPFAPNSIAGQSGGILNPGAFLAATNATNELVNLSSPLNTVW